MTYVDWLHDGQLSADRAGGKGASLSRLTAAGFAVPPGFVINVDGFRRFTGDWTVDFDQLDLDQIHGLCLETELHGDLHAEIMAAHDTLTAQHGPACAVRSSALAEDGAQAAFAGLYESFLNVQGRDETLMAVRRCYASLWSERSLQYRRRGDATPATDAMAVVIMGLVAADVAGVAFTAKPVTGNRGEVMVNASWGLGEAVVSGQVTPDTFIFDKTGFALTSREIAPKDITILSKADGLGVETMAVAPDRVSAPSLTDAQAAEVARLACAVEELFGRPQDIEFAVSQGRVYLLQARPITTL